MANISKRIRSGRIANALMAPGASRVVIFNVGKVALTVLGIAGVRIVIPDTELDTLAGALAQLVPVVLIVAHAAVKWWRRRKRRQRGAGNV